MSPDGTLAPSSTVGVALVPLSLSMSDAAASAAKLFRLLEGDWLTTFRLEVLWTLLSVFIDFSVAAVLFGVTVVSPMP